MTAVMMDCVPVSAEELERLRQSLALLRRVDHTGLLFRHNMDLDADVANLLAEIDREQPGLDDPADYRADEAERQTVSNHDWKGKV